jgi:antitoxin VapB
MQSADRGSTTESRTVSIFQNGRNQAVRIPRDFELPGKEARIFRDGDRLIIEPIESRGTLLHILETLPNLEETIPDVDEGLGEVDDVQL